MEKIRLSKPLGLGEVLTKNELKHIVGAAGGTCGVYIPEPYNLGNTSSYSTVGDLLGNTGTVTVGPDEPTVYRGVSKDTALTLINGIPGARWCCDSCNQISWY